MASNERRVGNRRRKALPSVPEDAELAGEHKSPWVRVSTTGRLTAMEDLKIQERGTLEGALEPESESDYESDSESVSEAELEAKSESKSGEREAALEESGSEVAVDEYSAKVTRIVNQLEQVAKGFEALGPVGIAGLLEYSDVLPGSSKLDIANLSAAIFTRVQNQKRKRGDFASTGSGYQSELARAPSQDSWSFKSYQDKGDRARHAPFDSKAVEPLSDDASEKIWPEACWNRWVSRLSNRDKNDAEESAKRKHAQKKLSPGTAMKMMLPELNCSNCLFELQETSGRESVCGKDHKPDVILKLKSEPLSSLSTGAIISVHSKTPASCYDNRYSLGELITYGEKFLYDAGPLRDSIVLGITNLKKIRWFRLEKLPDSSELTISRSVERTNVRASLCGHIAAEPAILGITRSAAHFGLSCEWRWMRYLGSGLTSNVYEVEHAGLNCALKVSKSNHSCESEFAILEILKDVDGVPKIYRRFDQMLALQPVGFAFTRENLCKYSLKNSLSSLVDILKAAHSKGIVHRDIRSANIMIGKSLRGGRKLGIFIIDWGFAAKAGLPCSFNGSMLTASNQVLTFCMEHSDGHRNLKFEPCDDLVSLLRCLYLVLIQGPMDTLPKSKEPAHFLHFWEDQIGRNYLWRMAEEKAANCEYDQVKKFLDDYGFLI